jgi:hypothetical protein
MNEENRSAVTFPKRKEKSQFLRNSTEIRERNIDMETKDCDGSKVSKSHGLYSNQSTFQDSEFRKIEYSKKIVEITWIDRISFPAE